VTLILPGPQPPRGGLSILVPRGYEDNDDRQRGECFLCGALFAAGDDVVAHMKKCVHAAGHDVRQERAEKVDRLEIFLDPNAFDPEVDEHMRKVGERMRAEGRWEVKPSERAGFS
jgi:hypothetical protein